MKRSIVLTIVCVFLLLGMGTARSDDKADVNAKIDKMQQTIDELKKEIENLKSSQISKEEKAEKKEEPAPKVEEASKSSGGGKSEGIHFGGHLKMYMADWSDGKRNDVDQNNNLSAGIHNAFIYISKPISDWLMLEVHTNTAVSAGATPRIGTDISRTASTSVSTKISEATITMRLPKEYELKFGVLDPVFSEEYGKQLWWGEQYNGNDFGLLRLEEWHDIGFELYRNFEFSFMSLPVYLYLLNGDDSSTFISDTYTYADNNAGKSGMIHIAPEIFVDFLKKLQLLGSFGYGKWDTKDDYDSYRYAVGLDVQFYKFDIMSEYLYRKWESVPLLVSGTDDGISKGYYVRVLYNFCPKWKGIYKYSDTELYKPGNTQMLTDNYKTSSIGLNYNLTDSSTIMLQCAFTKADRSDSSEKLDYTRYTLGWRTTF